MLTIEQGGTGKWTTMQQALWGCANLTVTATDASDLSGVASRASMFLNAGFVNADLSGWDTSSVTNMNSVFGGATSLNGDVTTWDTGSAGADCSCAEGDTSGFSSFLLGQQGQTPTAITLRGFTVRSPAARALCSMRSGCSCWVDWYGGGPAEGQPDEPLAT